jgi:PAS domain S-box-containing protein
MRNIYNKKLKTDNEKALNKEINTILDAIHDDILITDGVGKILKVSKSFKDVYGISEKDIMGETVFDMEQRGVFKPNISDCRFYQLAHILCFHH